MTTPTQISALSTEYVKVRVRARASGADYNPTGDTVTMSFISKAELRPVTGDWKTASWETANSEYYARCLVGPTGGTITLTPGVWYVWVKVTDGPEVPVLRAGTLTVF